MKTSRKIINVNDIDVNMAYLIGVLHSDGCIYLFHDKKRKRTQIRLNLSIGEKSLPMAEKFKRILSEQLGINVNVRKRPNKPVFIVQTSINRSFHLFKEWDKEDLLEPITSDINIFGGYLAGLIDGDGHIKIKNNRDRVLPQCLVRIASDHELIYLKPLVNNFLKCKIHFCHDKKSRTVQSCFYISKKNHNLFMDHVYPNMTMDYKKE